MKVGSILEPIVEGIGLHITIKIVKYAVIEVCVHHLHAICILMRRQTVCSSL